jgi:copper chaperone
MTKIFLVPNISCNHCIHTIKSELSEIEGVKQVDADVDTKEVKVVFDAPATEEKIVKLLTEINYPPSA